MSMKKSAKDIAEKNNCEYFTDWREMLDKVDAVSIVTPTETHCEIACAFLEKGVHGLVEKPIALTLEEADKMIASAQKTRREIDGRTSRKIQSGDGRTSSARYKSALF